MLERYDLVYRIGGKVQSAVGMKGATKSLSDLIKGSELISINMEFERAIDNTNTEPREACSVACNILESLFKIMIDEEKLEKPAKQDMKNLWKPVAEYLNFDPKRIEDNDLRKILSGMHSIVDGVGALRTHASSAHGAGSRSINWSPGTPDWQFIVLIPWQCSFWNRGLNPLVKMAVKNGGITPDVQ
ncbi:abortive infection family protein [Marinobacter flavimaris]|uniref:abortive infection family protein n=1 Tax=Marinobacter flavimaris TaxID=262076 RepID=UPI0018EE1214|nr:abortive infection family protein [Marinobacter flavimaris]